MAIRYAPSILLLYLLFLKCGHGNGVRDVKEENMLLMPQSRDAAAHENHIHAHPSFHIMDHVDEIEKNQVIFMNDLHIGKVFYTMFHIIDPSSASPFLPKEIADSIPFSHSQLPQILQLLSIAPDSPEAYAMKDTLRKCESAPVVGESKMCATSVESMIEFVRSIFGSEANFKAVTSSYPTLSTTFLQNYTITQVPKQIPASKMIGCHLIPYPYAVFYCHTQTTETKVFRVSLVGESGDRVEAAAACHMDTSEWDPTLSAFQSLGIKPGSSPICHFFYSHDLIWVRSAI